MNQKLPAAEICFQHSARAMRMERVTEPGAPGSPRRTMVPQKPIFEFNGHVTGTFAFHPRGSGPGADMSPPDGPTENSQHEVNVMAAVAEKLPPAQFFLTPGPVTFRWVGVLLCPNGKLEDVPVGLFGDIALKLQHQRVKAHTIRDHEDAIVTGRGGDHLPALLLSVGQRLFH